MSIDFLKAAEKEIIPTLELLGMDLMKKSANEITFSFEEFEFSFFMERELEVYGMISFPQLKQTIYFSELLTDYFHIDGISSYMLSERFPLELCLRKLVLVLTTNLLPLIKEGKIDVALNIVMAKRQERLHLYNDNLIEKEAKKSLLKKSI
jgi:hypothetical protein